MKTVLITGASSGIGKSTAVLFSERGWNVAAAMRNPEHFPELSEQKNTSIYSVDVRESNSIENCIERVLQQYGKIGALINNAGIYTTDPLELTPDELIDNIIKTNVNGVLHMTKAVLRHFRANRAGVIVNVSSVAGRVTFPFQSVYHASKWAIEGFCESLRYELKPFNILLKLVEPGMVKTNLYRSLASIPFDQYPMDYRARFRNWHTLLMKNYENGYDPMLDAKTIYRAVHDGSSRLRYTSDFSTKLILFLRSILPLSAFQNSVARLSKLR